MENEKIVIYQTEDGQTQIDVRLENETLWPAIMQRTCQLVRKRIAKRIPMAAGVNIPSQNC